MLWQEYVMNDHCAMYETLTIEEKMLINIEMKKWIAGTTNLCLPTDMFKIIELDLIERLKRKEENDRRNRKQSASRRNNK